MSINIAKGIITASTLSSDTFLYNLKGELDLVDWALSKYQKDVTELIGQLELADAKQLGKTESLIEYCRKVGKTININPIVENKLVELLAKIDMSIVDSSFQAAICMAKLYKQLSDVLDVQTKIQLMLIFNYLLTVANGEFSYVNIVTLGECVTFDEFIFLIKSKLSLTMGDIHSVIKLCITMSVNETHEFI